MLFRSRFLRLYRTMVHIIVTGTLQPRPVQPDPPRSASRSPTLPSPRSWSSLADLSCPGLHPPNSPSSDHAVIQPAGSLCSRTRVELRVCRKGTSWAMCARVKGASRRLSPGPPSQSTDTPTAPYQDEPQRLSPPSAPAPTSRRTRSAPQSAPIPDASLMRCVVHA